MKDSSSHNVLRLMRLLQLSSSNLPVGAYTFSQGLEFAIDAAWLTNEESVSEWILQTAKANLMNTDVPLILRQYACLNQQDWQASAEWNDYALALRETRELLLADTAMAEALIRLSKGLNFLLPPYFNEHKTCLSYVTVYSAVAQQMQIEVDEACVAYCWTVIEGQVLAATKLLPMGQTAAQKMLYELSQEIQCCIDDAHSVEDEEIGLSLPGLAMASAKHETMYSRLYRS